MKFRQEFTVTESVETVWRFFQQVADVAKCMPGIDNIQIIDPDHLTVRMTQKVGPISASFDTSVRITQRVAPTVIQFTLIGKAVRGAVGNFRATNTVTLSEQSGSTHVTVEGEAALAGALGSVGQRIIAKQAEKLTVEFASNLSKALSGDKSVSQAPVSSVPYAPRARALQEAEVLVESTGAGPMVQRSSLPRQQDDPWNKISASFSVATFIVSLFVLYHVISQG